MSRSHRDPPGPSTRAVHAGERDGRPRVSDALTTPIVQTATFWFRDTQELIDYQEGRHASFEYGRYGIPFYLLYRPGAEPHVFGELLTQDGILEALGTL